MIRTYRERLLIGATQTPVINDSHLFSERSQPVAFGNVRPSPAALGSSSSTCEHGAQPSSKRVEQGEMIGGGQGPQMDGVMKRAKMAAAAGI
jgi:hypothetical protein